jgi:hypothetical protein
MAKYERLWNASLLALGIAGILVICGRSAAELDLWGHIQWGGVFLDRGGVTRVDPFSYLSAGYPWIDHQWLGDVILAWSWRTTGASGLLALKLVVWALVMGLALAWLLRSGLPLLKAAILLFFGAALLNGFTLTIRPQMFTALGFSLTLLILLQAEQGRYRWLWGLPALFLLWANLHAGFLVGLGVVGIWGAAYLLTHRRREVWLRVLPPLVLSPLATLVNPYGIELPLFLLRHLGDVRLGIAEWEPLQINTLFGWAYLAWLILIGLGLAASRRPRSPGLILILALTACLPWLSQRHILFFSLAALWVGGPIIGEAWERWMPLKPSGRKRPAWALLLPVLAAGLLLALRPPELKKIPLPNPQQYPLAATALLEQSGVSGNLANNPNWGNFLTWHLKPKVKISLDSRFEQAYPAEVYNAHLRWLLGVGEWDTLLRSDPTDMALIDSGSPADNLLRKAPGWVEVFRDAASALYARQGSEQAKLLQRAASGFQPPAGAAFP